MRERTLKARNGYTESLIVLVIAGLLAAGSLFFSSALFAQATAVDQGIPVGTTKQSITDQEIQLMRQDIREERRQIIAANLPLTTEESAKFWPVYDQYIAETIKINDSRYALIKDYITHYSNMSDEKASNYIRTISEVDKAMIELRLKYLPTVAKILSPRKTAIFLQVDRRVQLMIDLQLASQIPLISPK